MKNPDQTPRSLFIPLLWNSSSPDPTFAKGSAIVGFTDPQDDLNDGMVKLDFEGNLYGAQNLMLFRERALHAWSRQAYNYPTSARTLFPRKDLQEIGTLDAQGQITWLDKDLASQWSGEAPEAILPPPAPSLPHYLKHLKF